MRHIAFLILFFWINLSLYAQFPGWAWVRHTYTNYEDVEKKTKIDKKGNLYYYHRYFTPTLYFSSQSGDTLTVLNSDNTGGSGDIVIAKFDSEANAMWAVSYGLPQGDEWITDLDVDNEGNVYVIGFYRGLYTKFGNTILTNPAFGSYCYNVPVSYGTSENWECCYSGVQGYTPCAFRAKISAQGNLIWVKNIIGSGIDSSNFSSKAVRLAVTPDGYSYVYVVGSRDVNIIDSYSGLNFGNNIVIPNDSVSATKSGYLAYFDPNGDAIWAKGLEMSFTSQVVPPPLQMKAIAPDGGLVYSYSRDTTGLNHTVTYLRKISNTGNFVFSTLLFDEHADNQGTYVGDFIFNNRIDFDELGNIYIGGAKRYPSTQNMSTDLTFFKLNNTGILNSIFQVPSDGFDDYLLSFTVTGIDTLCFIGSFAGQFVQLGNEILFNSNGVGQIADVYFARYTAGIYDWQTIISTQDDYVSGIESDINNNIYASLITEGAAGTLSNINYICNSPNVIKKCEFFGKVGNQTGMLINENSITKPILYPNPVHGNTFTIAGFADEKINIKIIDMQGRLVYAKNQIFSANPIIIDLSKGHYIIEISTNSNNISRLPLIVSK